MSPTYTAGVNQGVVRRPVWVIAADAGRARIFSAKRSDGRLVEVEDLLNPDIRLHERDATSSPSGHVTHGPGGIGQTFQPRHTKAEHSAELFARKICERLEWARQHREVGRIYLISEPTFLGLIRKNIDPEIDDLIVQEIAGDMSRRPASDIRKVLPRTL